MGLGFVAEKPPLQDQTYPAEAEVSNMMPVFLDTDNDGDRDFFLTVWNGYCRFFENNGDGTYTDRTHESGLAIVGHSTTAAFADFNRDGLLDVYIADWGGHDHLFRNDGGNTWSDVSSRYGLYDVVADPQPGWCAIWFDHDGDFWPDLYVGNDFGQPNFFYINNAGRLEDRARTHFPELNDPDRTIFQNNATMGQTLGDFDRDGDYDLFVANSLLNDLYRREGDVYIDLMESTDPQFTDLRVAMKNNDIGWYCDWSDLNNDGWLDLFMVNGFIRLCFYDDPDHPDCSGLGEREQPNLVWINDQSGSFLRVVDEVGLADLGWARSGALADFDQDGDIDVFVANTGYADAPATHAFWRNDSAGLGNWLVVRPQGVRSNREAIGAQLRVRLGDVVLMRDRFAASGYLSQPPEDLHFGLGDAAVVDELTIRWPSGVIDRWTDVAVNQRLMLTEGTSSQVPIRAAPAISIGAIEEGVRIDWAVDPDAGWTEFRIVRQGGTGWAGTLAVVPAEPGRRDYAYVDSRVEPGVRYTYRISASADGFGVDSEAKAILLQSLPSPLVVEPAVPNPFNPRTTVRFRLPDVTDARLRIVDALGRVVRELDVPATGGWQEVVWDGTDGSGRAVASGSYRFVVESDGRISSTPMTLVR
jgi:hypothetical protein